MANGKQYSSEGAGIATIVAAVVYLTGCLPPPPAPTLGRVPTGAQHAQSLAPAQERRMTLGVVQSTIREGIDQAAVATALGSPNIVTTDAAGNETWIYDKISTETSHSSSSRAQAATDVRSVGGGAGLGGLGLVGGAAILGGLAGVRGSQTTGAFDSAGEGSGARSQTQRTLTVVIKFDENKLVSKVSYNQSAF